MDNQEKETASAVETDLAEEVVTAFSTYTKTVAQVQSKLFSEMEKAWAAYWQSRAEFASKAVPACNEAYTGYVEACRSLPQAPDRAAVEKVQSDWVAAFSGMPELAKEWSATEQTLRDTLTQASNSAKEALQAAGESYSESLRSVFSRHGNLDPARAQFFMNQVSAPGAQAMGVQPTGVYYVPTGVVGSHGQVGTIVAATPYGMDVVK